MVFGAMMEHDLTAPTADAVVVKKNHQAAALLTNGLRQLNCQNHRQHHNQQKQQQHQQNPQEQQNQSNTNVQTAKQQQLQQETQWRQNQNHSHVLNSTKSVQRTMEAMKKLDAKLVAYLAGEPLAANCNVSKMEEQKAEKATVELCSSSSLALASSSQWQQLESFNKISGIKLQMEALTLQPEGTKRMELFQNDIRPIFTVECQLSHLFIESVPCLTDIMQFESEKFQSLTQCTRFGQEAQRAVKLDVSHENAANNTNNNKDKDDEKQKANYENKSNFGFIYFTVWWRESGTCLNEMLGMGVLALEELYAESLLEKCKRIIIQRRKVHLANLYFKITLLIGTPEATEQTSLSAGKESSIHSSGDELETSGDFATSEQGYTLNDRLLVEETKIQ